MYKRHRFPPEIIQHTVWLYHRFNLSTRDIEDLMAERGIAISYESIRLWCIKFGPKYAKRLRRRHQGYGDTFFIDEVLVNIQGKQHYLWRAVDQDGEVVDVFLQSRRDGKAAVRFFKRLLRVSGSEPRRMVTDKLRSYGVAHRDVAPDATHDTSQYLYQGSHAASSNFILFGSLQRPRGLLSVSGAVHGSGIHHGTYRGSFRQSRSATGCQVRYRWFLLHCP